MCPALGTVPALESPGAAVEGKPGLGTVSNHVTALDQECKRDLRQTITKKRKKERKDGRP